MYKGKIKALLGTELPIIQAPMAGVQDSALTIAVCQAGGLGSLPCGMLSIDAIVSELKVINASINTAYNLNFFCHQMPDYDEKQHHIWQEILEPYFDEFGLTCESLPNSANRTPFNHDIADAIEPFKPEFISFHFGLPEKSLIDRIKAWGSRVVSTATTLEEAIWLDANGVDGIIAQGLEAGGHRGMFLSRDITTQLGLSALLPQIVNKVSVPVIGAGGIGDANGVKSAFTLGADAAQVGTAYLLCDEAKTSQVHREALISEQSVHTALTNVFTGKPARGIVNRVMADLDYMSHLAPSFPHASIELTQLRAYAEATGSGEFSPLWSGQNTSGCLAISAKEMTQILAGKI